MTRIGIAQLKDSLSKILRAVEKGEEVEVTDRGRTIARIVPAERPKLTIIPPTRPFDPSSFDGYEPAGWAIDSLEILLEDRRRDRG